MAMVTAQMRKDCNGTNEIEQFFRGILNDIFTKDNSEEMFECLKKRASTTANIHMDLKLAIKTR
ncbi:hypothetical protein [Borrelia hermsii]